MSKFMLFFLVIFVFNLQICKSQENVLFQESQIEVRQQQTIEFQISPEDIQKNLVIEMSVDFQDNYQLFPAMVAVIKDIAGVPSYETFKEKILDNKKSDYYFDREAIVSQNQKHEILLHTPLYYGNYGLTFFNLFEESQTSYFIADIKIYYQDPEEYSCKSKCFGINNYSIASGLCLYKNCICQKGYFGESCGFQVEEIDIQGYKTITLKKNQWAYFQYSLNSQNQAIKIFQETQGDFNSIYLSTTQNQYSFSNIPNMLSEEGQFLESKSSFIEKSQEELDDYIKFALNKDVDQILYIGYYNQGQKAVSLKIWMEKENQEKPKNAISYFIIIPISIILFSFLFLLLLKFINWCKKGEQASASNSQQNSSQLSSENQYQVNNNQEGQNHQVIIYPSPIDMEPSYYNELMPVEKIEKVIEDYPKLEEIQECLICYLEFEKNENVRRTVCFHVFHDECIVTWWKKNNNCPTCRKILNKESVKNQNQEPMNPYISNIISHKNSVILGNSNNFNQFTSSLQLNQDPRFNLSIKFNNNNRPVSFNSQLETREANTSVNNVRANLNSLEDIKTENIFINTQLGNSQIFDESNTQARIDNEQVEQQENQQRIKPNEIKNINIKIKPQKQKNQNQQNSTFDVFSNRQRKNSIQILQDNSDSSNQNQSNSSNSPIRRETKKNICTNNFNQNCRQGTTRLRQKSIHLEPIAEKVNRYSQEIHSQIDNNQKKTPLKVLKNNSSSDSEDTYSESEQYKKSETQTKEQNIQQKFGNNIQNQDLIVSNKQVRRKRNKTKCQNLQNFKNNNNMTIYSQSEQNVSMENQN